MGKALNLLLGAILGGLVGSSLALLLAPMSGDELRTELKDYTRRMKNEMESAAEARRIELENELAALRGEVSSIR
jgi:gas vesicle protein